MADVPDEVRELVRRREDRRRARDFTEADALRERIRSLGFDVVDSPTGPEVGARPGRPAPFDASVHWVSEGWPEDVLRGIEAFGRHHPNSRLQQVVVDLTGSDDAPWPTETELVRCDPGLGWAAARNAGLQRASAPLVLVVDGSVEPTGDVLTPLAGVLADPAVGVAGPFGLVTDDLREFRESDGPEVHAVEGYLMAFRREVLSEGGGFDERFRFYRAADVELSFRIRDRGFVARVVPLPVVRHEHRAWANTPEDERDRLSRRNFRRFLDRWGGRTDLIGRAAPSS